MLERFVGRVRAPEHDPDLPPCPLCGAKAIRGLDFSSPTRIEHDCDCAYRNWEAYSRAVFALWPGWAFPRRFLQSLPPHYRRMAESPFPVGREIVEAAEKASVLYLHGPPGVGKTHTALRLALHMASRGKRAAFLPEAEFYRLARVEATSEEPPEPLVHRVDYLVLDDLGKARLTPFAAEALFSLVEAANGGMIQLVITSNHAPKEAARRMGEDAEALLSRIQKVFHLTGQDGRKTA